MEGKLLLLRQLTQTSSQNSFQLPRHAQREHEAELLVEEGISLEPLLEVRSLCSQFPQPLFEKGGQKKKEVPAPTHESVLCPKRRH